MFDFRQNLMHIRINLQELVRNWKNLNSIFKTYIYVIRRLRLKVQINIIERNLKQGPFITFWLIVNFRVKIVCFQYQVVFFINPSNACSFFKFQKKER